MSSSIHINGRNIVGGNSVVIVNGKVIVDGNDVTPENEKQITIEVTGDIASIEADVCEKITVTGNAGGVKTSQGDIKVKGAVSGKASTSMGNVTHG